MCSERMGFQFRKVYNNFNAQIEFHGMNLCHGNDSPIYYEI